MGAAWMKMEGAGAIRCYAPPRDTAGAVELFLALNGQNYARAASLVFTYTKVLRPAARSPTSGPSGGGTIVQPSSVTQGARASSAVGHSARERAVGGRGAWPAASQQPMLRRRAASISEA